MSLYGIETEDECKRAIRELVEMTNTAEEALRTGSMTAKVAVEDLKLRVTELFKKNKRSFGPRMSAIEEAYFWPAIQNAYIGLPKISSPKSWVKGVAKVKMSLRYGHHQPKKRSKAL